ncbi:MAG: Nucleoside-triphosphatase [Leptospirillum sp. Group IV 'UBA BS']|nr:MAG: Nucleoside-triphosphatase [Leptospirillum sp. Group IV 'UBA BS']
MAESSRLVLHLGTGNPHKAEEFMRMAPPGVSVLAAFFPDYPAPGVLESGKTFFANAFFKAETFARALRERTAGMVFSDDSGLVVPALSGEPGVRSARYAGEEASDTQNRELLLKNMKGLSGADRRAHFVCVLVAIDIATGSLRAASSGMVSGRIANGLMGEGGFGYDPLFVPEGYRASFGIMAPEEKNRISHRFRAFRQLCQALESP